MKSPLSGFGLADRRGWLVIASCALLAAVLSWAWPGRADEPLPEGCEMLDERPGTGEQCLVCRQPIHDALVVELRYRGRRFFVASQMIDEFVSDPETYFYRLEARSALFDEASLGRSMWSGWMLFGVYVLVGLLFGALSGALAVSRGRPVVRWFFAGLGANVVALGGLLALPRREPPASPEGVPSGLAKVPVTRAPGNCPSCGASHHPAASVCESCDSPLEPSVEPETARI